MPVQVEVQVDHSQHVFIVKAESILELPIVGNSIVCDVCGKKNSKVTHVGIPTRVGREQHSSEEGQKSILE